MFFFSSIKNKKISSAGFTLVEALVGAALFVIISVGIYKAYTSVITVISASRSKIVAMDLANERFEIIRNLPYVDVGIVAGIPNGVLTHVENLTRSGYSLVATTTVRNIDQPFDGTIGGSPNDTSPADNKFVEVEVGCPSCKNFAPIIVNTIVAPKNLETATTNGALFIKVLDASGQPVSGASVHIENNQISPDPIVIDDTTNDAGILQIVDAPPGVNAYEIIVTKSGFTTDKTYPTDDVNNPNPFNPHATVAVQQVTQTSFVIDKPSGLEISTITPTCSSVAGVDFNLTGTRLIGSNPDVFKYSENHISDGSGLESILGLEWDTYSLISIDGTYDIIGTNPVMPAPLAPDEIQNFELIVGPKNPRNLIISAVDAASGLPIANASVNIQGGGYNETLITGRGFLIQTDWSGGGGQATSTDPTKYLSSFSVDNNNPDGEIKLHDSFGVYETSGELVSSAFDTGSISNFHQLSRRPSDQPVLTGLESVRMQIATNNDATTWNFVGPDGTGGSYYTNATSDINPVHNGDRYLRYKILLSTENTSWTPNISDISFTFTSSCVPPGQVSFGGLLSGTYDVTITHNDYLDSAAQISVLNDWQNLSVLLTHE